MFFEGMCQFFERLREGSSAHTVIAEEDGLSLVRLDGEEDRFNDLAREILRRSGEDFVAFPTTDGSHGYERVFVVPLD
jgi:hypothetical protein